nr:translin-associated factor X-interacting protein 1 isoform X2 [Anolis sagrei ordinatus]
MDSRASGFSGLGISNQELEKRVSFRQSLQTLKTQKSVSALNTPSQKISLLKKQKSLVHSSSQLSSWPSYAPGQVILQNRKPCALPDWQRPTKVPISGSLAKPRYLEELESYLRKELQALDLTKGKVQELKLQPYREVFEFFMEEFKTYKPLLASIKNEYDLTIAHLQQKLHSLEAVNAVLVTASDQCTQQILALQKQEKMEITTLKKERLYLLELIDQMREEKSSLEMQVYKMRKAVAEEYLRYLNECDARKMLIIDLNEMYRLKEEMKLTKVQDERGEDTVKLTLALKMARQDLTKAQVDLNTMRANYGDVVPRREFELQEKNYNELDVIAGGLDRWSILSEGKSSDQLVDVLLEDLGTGLLKEREAFVGKGKNEKVPVFLRCDGLVRNKKLSKKEVVALLREIWRDKNTFDQQKGKRSNLAEFFLNFFQKKYGDVFAFDWTYTIFENIKLYKSNETMTTFYNILMGTLDEGVYHSHILQLSTLFRELTLADTASTGQLTNEQFTLALRTAFPSKTEEEIQELLDAAGCKSELDSITYRSLFLEDEEGKTELLVTKIKSQSMNEKLTYLRELRTELGNRLEVKPEDLRAAFCAIDPGLPEPALDSYVSWAFQLPKEQPDPAETLHVDLLMQRLMNGDIRRQEVVPGEAKNAPAPLAGEETEGPANA